MGKQRTTVTTCDGPNCDSHYFGSTPEPNWIEGKFTIHGADAVQVDKVIFCGWDCAGAYVAIPDTERPASGEGEPEGE